MSNFEFVFIVDGDLANLHEDPIRAALEETAGAIGEKTERIPPGHQVVVRVEVVSEEKSPFRIRI